MTHQEPQSEPTAERLGADHGPSASETAEGFVRKLYRTDPMTGEFLIEAALDRYDEVFNEWDPAPFRRRDLDPDFRSYLEDCAEDIPLKHPVRLVFQIAPQQRDEDRERRVRGGLRTYFAFELRAVERGLVRLREQMLTYLLVALVLLAATQLLNYVGGESLGANLLRDGLTIGAWVFAWEAVSLLAFRRVRLLRRRKRWRRFLDAHIDFADPPNSGP